MTFGSALKLVLFLLAGDGLLALWLTGELPPPLAAAAGLLLLLGWWAEPLRSRGLPPTPLLAAIPGLLAIGAILDFLFAAEALLIVAVRLLLGLTLYTCWTMRTPQDRWRLALLSLMAVVAAAGLTTRPAFLAAFAAAGLLSVWVLALLHLEGAAPPAAGLWARRDVATAGFFLGTGLLAFTAFALTALFFVLLPRLGGSLALGPGGGASATGFAERVTLGTFGRLTQDETVILRVAFPEGRPGGRIYWRGLALDTFDGEGWDQRDARRMPLARLPNGFTPVARPRSRRLLRQEISREALDTRVLFGAGWPVALSGLPPGLSQDTGGALYLPAGRAVPIQYVVLSDPTPPGDGEQALPTAERERHLTLPSLDPAIPALAREVAGAGATPAEAAARVEAYLSTQFTYSLDLTRPAGRGILEDFLFGRREGYCEVFATALAVLLRSLGIPARLVVGFLDGTWNEYGEYLAVRQADAHAWVEAFLPGEGWRTFDPSPRAAFDAARPPPLLGGAGGYLDFLWLRWNRYVVGFSDADQLGLAVRLRAQSFGWGEEAARGWERLRAAARAARPVLLLVLAAAVGAAGLLAWRRRGSGTPARSTAAAPTPFYALALRRVKRAGFPKPPGLTPAEFAESVVSRGGEPFTPLRELTLAYYAARFGGVRLSAEAETRLLALARALPRRPLAPLPRRTR
ncbi:MAG TPA: DUF3488 and transglutaminase-like domain-containing protein [Candidatus Methylomirabilis sp.]|nr:DUF3488 and transglutaminase-like domain-containing protein [Candidatus Methylomirabilis sp.]